MIKEIKKGAGIKLSKNFNSSEFDCHGNGCCETTLIDTDLIGVLQMIRANFGKAVIINSGFRCKTHNKNVGGASLSRHVSGMAADIVVNGIEPLEVAKYCESIGVLGIGLYDWGCHIDTRNVKYFWYSDSQEYRYTFGGQDDQNNTINILLWQKAAIEDGFKFSVPIINGKWNDECAAVAKKAVCKHRLLGFRYKNLTKLIQEFLKITPDGLYGKNTENAVKKYQSESGLKADGIVGINTWKSFLGV